MTSYLGKYSNTGQVCSSHMKIL